MLMRSEYMQLKLRRVIILTALGRNEFGERKKPQQRVDSMKISTSPTAMSSFFRVVINTVEMKIGSFHAMPQLVVLMLSINAPQPLNSTTVFSSKNILVTRFHRTRAITAKFMKSALARPLRLILTSIEFQMALHVE